MFQFLLNPIRIIIGLGVFLKFTSLFQGAALVFGNLTRNSSIRQRYRVRAKESVCSIIAK